MNPRLRHVIIAFRPVHWFFLLTALFFGSCFIFITPPFWGYDENSHYGRAYEISSGVIRPNKNDLSNYGAIVPDNVVALGDFAIGDLVNNSRGSIFDRKDVDDRAAYEQYTSDSFSDAHRNLTNSSSYSPVAYIGPVAGILISKLLNFNVGTSILLARLMSLVVYIALAFAALYFLRDRKVKWLFLAVALLPMSLFQAATISADGLLIATTLLLLASIIGAYYEKNSSKKRTLFITIAASIALLPLIKSNYILLALPVLVIPGSAFISKNWTRVAKVTLLCVAVLLVAGWSLVSNPTVDAPISQRPDGQPTSVVKQMQFVVSNPVDFVGTFVRSIVIQSDAYLSSMVGLIGWNYVQMPSIFIFFALFLILIAGLYAKNEIRKYSLASKYIFGLIGITGIAMILGIMYLAFTPVGSRYVEGVQGRYFIPYIIPVVISLIALLPLNIRIDEKSIRFLSYAGLVCMLSISTGFYVLATY